MITDKEIKNIKINLDDIPDCIKIITDNNGVIQQIIDKKSEVIISNINPNEISHLSISDGKVPKYEGKFKDKLNIFNLQDKLKEYVNTIALEQKNIKYIVFSNTLNDKNKLIRGGNTPPYSYSVGIILLVCIIILVILIIIYVIIPLVFDISYNYIDKFIDNFV